MPSSRNSSSEWQPELVHVIFLTAMEDELSPIRNFSTEWIEFPIEGFPHYYTQLKFTDKISGNDITLNVVACSPYQMGTEATIGALHRLHKLNPKVLVMTGICAGWREKDIHQGDVIIAERAFFPDEGKRTDEGLLADTRTFEPIPSLINHLKSVEHTLQWEQDISLKRPHTRQYLIDLVLCEMEQDPTPFRDNKRIWKLVRDGIIDPSKIRAWLEKGTYLNEAGELTGTAQNRVREILLANGGELRPVAEPMTPKVHYRTFATVPNVVVVEGQFARLEPRIRSIGAIEMEVAALYQASRELGYDLVFAIKGVQDYGTPDKDDLFREYAAEAAARWAWAFIREKWNVLSSDSDVSIISIEVPQPHQIPLTKYGDSVGRLAKIRNELLAVNSDPIVVESYDRILRDLEKAWSSTAFNTSQDQIESFVEFFDFGEIFRKTLIQSSITSSADNYSPEMIKAAIQHGIWEISEAINIVERMPDARQRIDACAAILEAKVSAEGISRLHRIFFDAVKKYTSQALYVDALKKIAPMLHSSFTEEAIQIIQEIHFLSDRATALAVLLPNLDEQRRQVLVREYMTLISLEGDSFDRGRALAAIAPYLSYDLIDEAINIAGQLNRHHERSAVVKAIAPQLTSEQVLAVYQIAISIREGSERADAISALAATIPLDLLDSALAVVENVDEIFARSTALVKLSLRIDDVERKKQILERVFQDIQASNNTVTLSDFPTQWLYPDLPDEYQIRAIKSSFDTATLVGSGLHRAEAFGLALFRICEREDKTGLDELFERGFQELLHLAVAHCGSLTLLLPYLPEPYKTIAVQTVRETLAVPIIGEDAWEKQFVKKNRITWAARILPFLTDEDKETVLPILWELAFSISSQSERFDALEPLIPVLTGRDLRYLLNSLSAITDYSSRAAALARIGQHLLPSIQHDIVERILNSYLPEIPTEREKALAIARIASLLQHSQLQKCMDLVANFEDEGAITTALANLAISAQNPPIDEIYARMFALTDGNAQALLMDAIADKLTSEQIRDMLPLVNLMSAAERKIRIIHAIAPKLTQVQIEECFVAIQSKDQPLINIVVAASLYPVMEQDAGRDFLKNSVDVILSTTPDTAQFGIAWAASSIADLLDDVSRMTVLNFACHALAAMSGNMSTYPGGNPKANAFKKLIPKLDIEMQRFALSDIQTIPHLGGLQHEDNDPVSDVLAATAADLDGELIPTALDLLEAKANDWNKTYALELIARRVNETHWNQFTTIAKQLDSGWMRARVWAALLEHYPRREEVVKLVRGTLLVHLLQIKEQTREDLLSSVDVHLYKEPFMSTTTLEQIVHHIVEICDEWK